MSEFKIYNMDVLEGLKRLDSESIDCVVTSPPYYALRNYVVEGQVGLEGSPKLYIDRLLGVFDEVKRVLKKEGSVWVNIGDSYSATRFTGNSKGQPMNKFKDGHRDINPEKNSGLEDKTLIGIPFRFAFGMIDSGWLLRNTVIWHKNSCMPCSVKDRFTVDFEYFFFFVKNKKYFFEQQLEPLKESSIERNNYGHSPYKLEGALTRERKAGEMVNLEGRNMRCVWTINPKPYRESHFAVFPPKLVETPLKACVPKQICIKCGKPREKIIESVGVPRDRENSKQYNIGQQSGISIVSGSKFKEFKKNNPDIISFSDCGCNAGFKAGIVLDPFCGSGTTLMVARDLGLNGIGIELNDKYIPLIRNRIETNGKGTELLNKPKVEVI
jgi:DNA modification methylase